MNGTIDNSTICGREYSLYLPEGYCARDIRYPVVYINGEDSIDEIIEIIEPHFNDNYRPFIMVSIKSANWNEDFSPWLAPALTKKDEPFAGRASEYINFVSNILKPFIDKNYRTKPEPENTAMIGYSLGGLAALYALYTCGTFGRIGSLSSSMWYDGWVEFMDSRMPANSHAKVYLSLGRNEEHSRNQRMASVGECTRKAAEILKRQLAFPKNVILEWNNGGHFTEITERFEKVLLWLM